MDKFLNQLSASIPGVVEELQHLPPVERWHPPLSGDIDIEITRDGLWLHEGAAFTRDALVKLFSSILKREGGDYFLVTPVEKWRIKVALAPLLVIDFDVQQFKGHQTIIFRTATGDIFPLDEAHALRWVPDTVTTEQSNRLPLVTVRNSLEAMLTRAVYYRLAELADTDDIGCFISSAGHRINFG